MWSGKLGFRKTEHRLEGDVNVRAIEELEAGYEVIHADKLMLGGDAPKSFINFPIRGGSLYGHAYIAKGARKQGPRECVTESLISAVAAGLPLQLARSRLVVLRDDRPGEADVRFMSRYFLNTDRREILTHGVELVGIAFDIEADAIKKEIPRGAESDFYTVDLVEEVQKVIARTERECTDLLSALGKMLGFDAIVGANDRHPRNWGIIESAIDPAAPFRFAPVFDTSRALFWNFSDEQLLKKQRDGNREAFLQKYAGDSRPLIGVPGSSPCNHFELVRHIMSTGRERPLAKGVRRVIAAFSLPRAERTLHRRFGRVLSRYRLELIRDLLVLRNAVLKEICAGGR